ASTLSAACAAHRRIVPARSRRGSRRQRIPVAHEPICDAESDEGGSQSEKGSRRVLIGVEDDELSRERQRSDKENSSYLNDARPRHHHFYNGVIEFERNQHGHDLAEDYLEYPLIQRVEQSLRKQQHYFPQ